jgi:hypothetical protein
MLIYGADPNTIKKYEEALLEASRKVGLEVNAGNAEYMVVFCHQNAGQNYTLLTANKFFEMRPISSIWEQ